MATKTKSPAKKPARKAPARKRPAAKKKSPAKRPAQRQTIDKDMIRTAQKNPTALTVAQRRELVEGGHVMGGLVGKARELYIEYGERPSDTVKKAGAAAKTTATGRKAPAARKGVMGIHPALEQALADGPLSTADAAAAVSKLRGQATTASTVASYLRDGAAYGKGKDGLWKLA